jgi:hypothetical protein
MLRVDGDNKKVQAFPYTAPWVSAPVQLADKGKIS